MKEICSISIGAGVALIMVIFISIISILDIISAQGNKSFIIVILHPFHIHPAVEITA
jgi:hypothetical protein